MVQPTNPPPMIKHNGYLLVKVSEIAYRFEFKGGVLICYNQPFRSITLIDIKTPGNHQIIGLAKDLTEEQWKGITPKMPDPMIDLWENFEDKQMWALTAVESGMTLLRKHSLEPNQTLILKEVK